MTNNTKVNGDLVRELIDQGVLKSKQIIKAFYTINRKHFVINSEKLNAYTDYPLPIGFGQTISQPHIIAHMLELLKVKKGDIVLDVGSGSGRTTTLLAQLVGRKGRVYGVDIIPELVSFGKKNLTRYGFTQAKIELAGTQYGLPKYAPYDKILVSAAGEEIPKELFDQLKSGGKMIIPIKNKVISLIKKIDGRVEIEEFGEFTFVPLLRPIKK